MIFSFAILSTFNFVCGTLPFSSRIFLAQHVLRGIRQFSSFDLITVASCLEISMNEHSRCVCCILIDVLIVTCLSEIQFTVNYQYTLA